MIAFAFGTKVENPLPVLTTPEAIAQQMSGCRYEPEKARGVLKRGETATIRLSVNEQGKLTGESYKGVKVDEVMQKTRFSTYMCRFKPYMVDGKASYYYIDLLFTAP